MARTCLARDAAFSLLLRAFPFFCAPRADRGNALANRHLESLACRLVVVEAGHRDARQRTADRALDGAEIALLLGGDEGERIAGRIGARRAPDAVDVVVRYVRHVEVHDVA